MAAPTIATGLKQLLARYMPFSSMAPEHLNFVIEHVEVAYFEPGETILGPSSEPPAHCYIVKQGRVQGETTNEKQGEVAFEAGVGDCFPVGALLAGRPVSLVYRSVTDTFCLLLPRARFEQLAQMSGPFLDFCKRRLGALLDLSRQQLQATYASEASAERTMNTALRDLVRSRKPLTCAPDTPLREAFGRMHQGHVGSIIVVEGDAAGGERLAGILTRTDLIGRVILPEVPLTAPVSTVMTRGVRSLDEEDTAADATLLMAEHSIRHIPVMRREGGRRRVVGVVSERDLFALHRLTVRQLAVAIRRADSAEGLSAVAADIRRLSHHLVAQGVGAAQLTRLISHLNDQLTVRLLALACEKYRVDPQSFCWLSFGSEGRGEQTIATDQDNGILYVESDGARERLLELADFTNEALAACGFPLCRGNIMARNPELTLGYAGWEEMFMRWIDRGDPEALLAASIYFDFRPLFGDILLANQLRVEVVKRAQANPRFLKQMSDNAMRNRPPAPGRFTESLFGEAGGPDRVDLKMHGTVPFVDAARIWALRAGLHETNTSERYKRLAEAGQLPADDVDGWVAAFEYFQLMRLRAQHRREHAYGASHDDNPNEVELRLLSPLDRRILNESFRQARKVQQRLELDFPG
jgi:CBS domain-containing protein